MSHVAINYGKESQKELDTITVSEGRRYQQEGHFPPGSMGPKKMEAALLFVENGGHKSIITSPEEIGRALKGEAGTIIIPEPKKKLV